MSRIYWSWKGITCILCLAICPYPVLGRRYDKCTTPDDRQGVCVVRRYCREATSHPLVPCDDDDGSYCCPIPTPGGSTTVDKPRSGRDDFPESSRGTTREDIPYDRPTRGSRPRSDFEDDIYGKVPDISRENTARSHERRPDEFYEPKIHPSRGSRDRTRPPLRSEDDFESRPRRVDKEIVRDIPERKLDKEIVRDIPERRLDKEIIRDIPERRLDKEIIRDIPERRLDKDIARDPERRLDKEIARDIPERRLDKEIARDIPERRLVYEQEWPPLDDRDRSPSRAVPTRRKDNGRDESFIDRSPPKRIKFVDSGYEDDEVYDEPRRPSNSRRNPPSRADDRGQQRKDDTRRPHDGRTSIEGVRQVPGCGVQPYEMFIAGGETSGEHEWPWMTAIFRRHESRGKSFVCGGSLINNKYILTAAHCLVNNFVKLPASSFVVRLGSYSLSSGDEYPVSDLVLHQNHSGSDYFNDIALIRLASSVYVSDKVAPVCLPHPGTVDWNLVGKLATVAGWGDVSFRASGTRHLQHVEVPIVSSDECFFAYSRVRGAAFLARGSDHVICAGLKEGGKDACPGDSGGPLMLKDSEGKWVIVGIVSLGYKCAQAGYPGVYTRVTHYMSWIQDTVKRH